MSSEVDTPIVVAMIAAGPAMLAALAGILVQGRHLGRRMTTVEDHASTAAAELSPNHGGSAKDAVTFVLEAVGRLEAGQEAIAKDVGGIRSEMRTERTERIAVADRVTALERRRRAG